MNASNETCCGGDGFRTDGSDARGRRRPIGVRLREALDDLWDLFVDPRDAYRDPDGTRWQRLSLSGSGPSGGPAGGFDERQLAEFRDECRLLAATNEFAINGHENRINYIVGAGHRYRAAPRPGRDADAALLAAVQEMIDQFVAENDWRRRQQEIVRRLDRDGECFLRLFPQWDGVAKVRFIEPEQVAAPAERAADERARFGILTAPDDAETPLGFYVDGRLIDAQWVQHRKANVDANAKRGLPLFLPVRKNLRRAEKLLRNMSVVSEIQSAIAIIRKHNTNAMGLDQFLAQSAEPAAGPQRPAAPLFHYAPGTILDAGAGTQYEFPAAGIDAARFVAVLQAELRAIASRLVMPEFMLTSDASNANYASTMVAEGPAVRMFERLQHDLMADDCALLTRVLRLAVAAERLPPEALRLVTVAAFAPSLASRDRLRDAQADRILVAAGAMSVETMAVRHGLDPRHEQRLRPIGAARTAPDAAAVAPRCDANGTSVRAPTE